MYQVYNDECLMHHGVKGMKWGVRRYRNKDGTLTPVGKQHLQYRRRAISSNKTIDDVNDILKSMNADDLAKILAGDTEYLSKEQGSAVIKRILKRDGEIPVAFFDMLDDGDSINVIVGTRSGNKYRGKGYASDAVAKGMQWLDKHKNLVLDKDRVVWGVRADNAASIKLALKNGFRLDKNSIHKDKNGLEWMNYTKRIP